MAEKSYYNCRHPDCIYKGSGAWNNLHAGCDYAIITGRCRSTQPGGKHAGSCTLYIPKNGEIKKAVQKDGERPSWEPTAMGMLRAGYSLPAIARVTCQALEVIERWAKKREAMQKAKIIEPPRRLIERGPHFDWEGEARRLWAEGKSDKEVAEITGCSVEYAGKVRRKMGIACQQQRRGNPNSRKPAEHLIIALHAAGLNDNQIGEFRGVSAVTVRNWRAELGLAKNGPTIRNQEKARRIYDEIMKEEEHGQA